MANRPQRIQELFQKISSLPVEERRAATERECGSDLELRTRLEALLRGDDEKGKQLEAGGADPGMTRDSGDGAVLDHQGATLAPSSARDRESLIESDPADNETMDFQLGIVSGAVIADRYTLKEKIGEGGMGDVWLAWQTSPVKRKVALKLIKTGMDSKAVLARFDQERQALAMMDHPNIAKVLDGGMTPAGQPFFVMELVNGISLGRYCDESRLSPRGRLELFLPICQAVQHAHHKGIVHRDLKPANILVTIVDGKPIPKVIDFGVAKATSGKLLDESMATHFGAVVGTLEYMSPEQAGFSGVDIDTRADIYSLGVILYELLTGLRPIDANRLRKAAVTEMIRIIREEEPSKPSTRLSTHDSLPSMAALRQTDPRRLMALLKGELDWIVLKCLEKNRDRRYETANALGRDIQHYLSDEPVEARPPSTAYRISKFFRRNKGPVLAVSFVLLALVLGIVGTSWGFINARNQRIVAESNERVAKERLGQLEKATESLANVFRNLDPNSEEKEGLPLRAILARNLKDSADTLQGNSVGDPLPGLMN